MNYSPSDLPEMCDVEVDKNVEARVQEVLDVIADSKNFDTAHYLTNVGLAMIYVCHVRRLSLAEQWLVRQRLLEAEWDEVEFELQATGTHAIAMIKHKYTQPPRTLHVDLS